jgi:hypothetical protein
MPEYRRKLLDPVIALSNCRIGLSFETACLVDFFQNKPICVISLNVRNSDFI